jgi:hypothetical protein
MASQTETLVSLPSDHNNAAVISTPASIPTVPRNVHSEVGYYTEPEGGGPQPTLYIKDEKFRAPTKRNFQPIIVHDVRGSGVEHTLDETGIQFINHKSTMKDFDDDMYIKDAYYPEITELLYKV